MTDETGGFYADIGDHPSLSRIEQQILFDELDRLCPFRRGINQRVLSIPDDALRPDACNCQYPEVITKPSGHTALCPVAISANAVVSEIASYLYKLVVSIANKYSNINVPLEDLIQEGNIGLVRSIWKFDQARGLKLPTYATWWIRQATTRALADQGSNIRIPVHVLNKYIAIAVRHDGGMADQDIANSMGLPVNEVISTRSMVSASITLSLDHPSLNDSLDDGDGLHQSLADNTLSPERASTLSELRQMLNQMASALPDRQRKIMEMRHGLNGSARSHTLQEISIVFGLSRERIRQLENEAMTAICCDENLAKLKDFAG